MTALKSELHLHLYGCLTPQHLYDLGKDMFSKRSAALDWYRSEYLKITGTEINWQSYWSGSHGVENIAKDFLATKPMTFLEFQARFNLMIALLPTTEFATLVMRQVVAEQVAQEIDYAEYRIFVPPILARTELSAYYLRLATEADRLNKKYAGQHVVRIILSMSRNPATFGPQYEVLKDLQLHDPVVTAMITGIDFCGVEEGFPPEPLAKVCATIRQDNTKDPERSLAILYHVGESFDQMSIFSAMRWIVAADLMGAHRLGHAIAAGVNTENCDRFADGTPFSDPPDQSQAMIKFLRGNTLMIQNQSVRKFLLQEYQRNSNPEQATAFVWNQDLRAAAKSMQESVLSELKRRGAIIESCPTSNQVIGRIANKADLPVFRFAENDLNLLISSDDPGIFAITLASEEELVAQTGGLQPGYLDSVAENNQRFKAGTLAGRSLC